MLLLSPTKFLLQRIDNATLHPESYQKNDQPTVNFSNVEFLCIRKVVINKNKDLVNILDVKYFDKHKLSRNLSCELYFILNSWFNLKLMTVMTFNKFSISITYAWPTGCSEYLIYLFTLSRKCYLITVFLRLYW